MTSEYPGESHNINSSIHSIIIEFRSKACALHDIGKHASIMHHEGLHFEYAFFEHWTLMHVWCTERI